jgi:hypothetical protein
MRLARISIPKPLGFVLQKEHGEDASQEEVAKLMPSKVKNRRKIQTEDGVSAKASVKVKFAGDFEWCASVKQSELVDQVLDGM